MNYLLTLKKAILGGLYIGIGCTIYLYIDNKTLGAFLFSLGLYTIILLGLNLFTGKIGFWSRETYKDILITLVGNFIGINAVSFMMRHTRGAEKMIVKATELVNAKMSDTYISLFILGIFCGILMFTAYAIYKKHPDILGAIAIIMCVAVFILAGFEHCIADMYYFSMAVPFTEYIVPLIVIILGNAAGGIGIRLATEKL